MMKLTNRIKFDWIEINQNINPLKGENLSQNTGFNIFENNDNIGQSKIM